MISNRKRPHEEAKAAAEKKKQKKRRHYGLKNQGDTCYLNSVLQVLFKTTEIHDRLDPNQITDQELRNIFVNLEETTCGTENITKSLEIKNVNQQRDAAECLEMILCKISPHASEVFQGELRYITKCSKGHIINEETNPFWTLPLSLKDAHDTTYSVKGGFESIFQTKLFSGDNMVYCNECDNKTEATTGCEMVESPQILTLLLKRFDFDFSTMSYFKSNRCVDVPCALQRKNKTYKLYGMVNHMGSLYSGHYTATILSNEDETWYEFDDSYVEKVQEQPFVKIRTYNSSTAYLLMYRAPGSLRDEVKKQHEHKGEHKRKLGQRDADDKENRHLEQNQESLGQMGKEKKKEVLSHQVREEVGDAKQEKKVSSFSEDIVEEDALLCQKQNTSYSSKQHPDNWTKAEKRKQRGKKEEGEVKNDENSLQPCKSSTNIKKKPLWIFLIVFACALIMSLLVLLLTTLNKP